MKRMFGYLLAILIVYVGLLVLLRVFENRLIFFPDIPGRLIGDWQPRGLPVEDVWLHAADGVKLHAWWIAAPGAEFTFVAFHGNAANIANRADIYEFLRSVPANVLAVEYRGYGKSEGTPTEAGLYLDAQAAYEYLVKDRAVPPGRPDRPRHGHMRSRERGGGRSARPRPRPRRPPRSGAPECARTRSAPGAKSTSGPPDPSRPHGFDGAPPTPPGPDGRRGAWSVRAACR